jgi:hypothetical protein
VETISSFGYLHVDSHVRLNEGGTVTRLLKGVAKTFAKKSVQFLGQTNRFPFVYSEKAMDSVLLPALAEKADAVTTEYPVIRKTRGRGSTFGFLDYWVFHHRSLLMIETKHVWVNPSTRKITGYAKYNWNEANHQTDRIPMSDIRNDLAYTGLDASKIFRVPMLVAPFWSSVSRYEQVTYPPNDLVKRHRTIAETLHPIPNWSALWLLKPELQGPYDWSDETHQKFDTYPAVGFYAYVHVRG